MPRVDISEIDLDRLMALGLRITNHVVGAHIASLWNIGDKLGLFEELADHGPISSTELAAAKGLSERYVREWAKAFVAADYFEVDDEGRFWMPKESIMQLVDEESPAFCGGMFQLAYGLSLNVARLAKHFRDGGGIGYGEIGEDVTVAVERLWRPCHEQFLPGWLELIPGLCDRLRAGGMIADLGCGRGRSTVSLACQFPASTVVGIDSDAASIAAAQVLAGQEGGPGNIEWRVASVDALTDRAAFDFAYMFHALHDMPGAVAALGAVRQILKDDGLLLCVESSASDDPVANRGTFSELYSTVSPLFNLPVAMSSAGDGSGTIVTREAVGKLATEAGFGSHELLAIDFPPPALMHRFHILRP